MALPRRSALLPLGAAVAAAGGGGAARQAAALTQGDGPQALSLPLTFERGAYYLTFRIDGRPFRGVLDTGSPYALVSACTGQRQKLGRCASYCERYGCSELDAGAPSGLDDNIVTFAGARAAACWRRGQVELGGAPVGDIVFGVLGDSQNFGGNAGGANFGLISGAAAGDPAVRPTFLEQTRYRTLAVDLRNPGAATLELGERVDDSTAAGSSLAKLLDLRPLGAPVAYYAVEVESLLIDGEDVLAPPADDSPAADLDPFVDGFDTAPRRAVAVIDTGTTGLSLPFSLYRRYEMARRGRRRLAQGGGYLGSVRVQLAGLSRRPGPTLELRRGAIEELQGADLNIVTPIADDAGTVFTRAEIAEDGLRARLPPEERASLPPAAERPAVIFLGLGFLVGSRVEVDTQRGQVAFHRDA